MRKRWIRLLYDFFIFVVQLLVFNSGFLFGWRFGCGQKTALFNDAFAISLLGTIISSIFIRLIPQIVKDFTPRMASIAQSVGLIFSLVGLLLLIKHYYEKGWLGALAVAVLAVIAFLVLSFIFAILFVLPFLFLLLVRNKL